jgi:hypothetical protein
MKSLVFSELAEKRLSENHLSFREQDDLWEHLHPSLEFFSRISIAQKVRIPVKIDILKIEVELEIRPTSIFIAQVHLLGESC